MRFGTLQQASPLFITSSVVSAGKMNGSLFHLCRSDRQLVTWESRQSLSVTAEVAFSHLTDASSDILDALKVSCLVFSCCPEGHGCQHYFFLFANPMQKTETTVTQMTPDISSDQPPVILIALGHVVRCCLECIPKTKSHTD